MLPSTVTLVEFLVLRTVSWNEENREARGAGGRGEIDHVLSAQLAISLHGSREPVIGLIVESRPWVTRLDLCEDVRDRREPGHGEGHLLPSIQPLREVRTASDYGESEDYHFA